MLTAQSPYTPTGLTCAMNISPKPRNNRSLFWVIADYKAHQGTTLASERPMKIFGDEAHLANALGRAWPKLKLNHFALSHTTFKTTSLTRNHLLKLCNLHRSLLLGITDYKAHQGTTLASERPLEIFGGETHLANALGNACVVVTSDGLIPVMKRSSNVGR